jgi:hypothetical protein
MADYLLDLHPNPVVPPDISEILVEKKNGTQRRGLRSRNLPVGAPWGGLLTR